MNLVVDITLILIVSYFLVYIAKKINVPGVVMLILAGLLLNIPAVGNLFVSGNESAILTLGDVGLFALMFLAGLEVSWKKMFAEKRDSTFIAFFASLLPFTLGTIIFTLLGLPPLTAAMIGITMSITAEATKARVLMSLNKLKTRLGATMMGAGIMDDFIGLGLFFIVASIFGTKSGEIFMTLGVTGAFFLGIISHKIFRKGGLEKRHVFEKFLLYGIIPFFFISMGVHFNLKSLVVDPWIVLVMIAIAISGKIGGVFLTRHWTKFKTEQLWLIGWAMNSRGAIELALALIALNVGLLSVQLYSGVILMALTTTLIFPFVITHIIKKHPGIMK